MSANGISWSDITVNATSKDYQPGTLIDTTYFRRKDYAQYCDSTFTNFVMISVRAEVPKPIVPVNPAYCKGTNVIVNVLNPTYNYNWYNTLGTLLHSGSSHSVTNIQQGQEVFVEAIDVNNCNSVFDIVLIKLDSIKAGFTASTNHIVVGDYIQFKAQNYSVAAVSWNWNFYDGDGSTLENPYHYYNTPGSKDVLLEVTSSNGCVDSILENVVVTVGASSINEIGNVGAVKIYPNPTSDILYIDLLLESKTYEVSIMDITGKILFTEDVTGTTKHQLDFTGYADGVYMIKILNDQGVKIGRVIKKS
jgi:PKD repeat protein